MFPFWFSLFFRKIKMSYSILAPLPRRRRSILPSRPRISTIPLMLLSNTNTLPILAEVDPDALHCVARPEVFNLLGVQRFFHIPLQNNGYGYIYLQKGDKIVLVKTICNPNAKSFILGTHEIDVPPKIQKSLVKPEL